MKALLIEKFGEKPKIANVPDPKAEPHGVVIKVEATGLCRSDWHAWMGHDSDVELPHVPGHELAGTIVEVGKNVTNWKSGDRVTVPFVSACGHCGECRAGHQQVCDNQFQPGFTHWGSYAEYVGIHFATQNLIALPETMEFATAASLGCRFATSFRAVVDQARTRGGEWVAVHGCGGVGLSAIMIARALGAQVVAIDINEGALTEAKKLGVTHVLRSDENIVEAIREVTQGGAHVSIDALGSKTTCFNSIACLRKRGRHVQIGLMLGDQANPPIPMGQVIAKELEIYGSHGMQAHRYDAMLSMISSGALDPARLIGKRISLEESVEGLMDMNKFQSVGATVITKF